MRSPADLRDKLRRDYARLAAHPGDADLAFNFFATADRLPDWLYPEGDGRRTGIRNLPLLALCSALATGAAHFRMADRRHRTSGKALDRGILLQLHGSLLRLAFRAGPPRGVPVGAPG